MLRQSCHTQPCSAIIAPSVVRDMKAALFHQVSPRWRKWLLRLGLAFVLYSVIGFFLLPPLIRWQMLKRLPVVTKRQAVVQQVKVNPWTLSLTIRGLALTEPDGRRFVAWDELYVNFQASSLFRWAWTFKDIRLVEPFSEIIVLKDGSLNFANMLESSTHAPPSTSKPASIPRINIFHVSVTNGFLAAEDRLRRSVFRTEYRPINVELNNFTTRPESDAPYSFHAESDAGRSVTWAGDFSVQPLRSSGHLEFTGIQLKRYQPYLEDFTRAVITNGLADAELDYRLGVNTNGLNLVIKNGVLRVEQVQVLDPDTGEIVAGLRGLEVQDAGFNLRDRATRLGSVKVFEASLLARLNKNRRLNLLDLLTLPAPGTNTNQTAPASAPAPAPAFSFSVDDFTIEKTSVRFEDLTHQSLFKTELKPIEVSVKRFTTRPDSDASYTFHVASEAAETFEGAGTFSINPRRSAGEARFSSVDVKKYLPFAEDLFRGQIITGKVEGRVPYRFAHGTNGVHAGVTNFAVKLTELDVLMPESAENVTHIDEIGFDRVDASLDDHRARVGLFKGSGGSLRLRREKNGALNLVGLLAVARTNAAVNAATVSERATAAQPEPKSSSALGSLVLHPRIKQLATRIASAFTIGGWVLDVDELSLTNYTVKVEDLFPPKPGSFLIDQLALNVKGASTVSNTLVTAAISLRANETGSFAAQGTTKFAPLFADFTIALSNLDLRPAQPYIEDYVRLGIVSGAFSTSGRFGCQTTNPALPQVSFTGGLRIANFVLTDQVMFKEFVRWEDFDVTGIDFAFQPNHLKVESARLVRPHGSVIIGADRRPNVSLIVKGDDSSTNSTASADQPGIAAPATNGPTSTPGEPFPVQLGTFAFERGSFGFTDESVQPHVTVGIEEMSGTIKGLSSTLDTTAEVDLAGKVDAQSPFAISGRANPFAARRFVDLAFTNANTQLTPVTGYMEKYGGHPLNKGRLSMNLRYRIEDKDLKAENKVRIDQLALGPRNNSPDATKLPVKLGVALLKDSEGRIELDVPVTGRLDDPQFRLGPIVLKVILNMIGKAVASPFKLLGSLVGGGGDELSFVEFKPGDTNVVEGELDKLTKLAAALAKRPALSLEIEAAVDPALDRDALALRKLGEQLKATRLQELNAKGRAPESIETFQIEPEERERLLRAAFVAQFGTNIAEIIQTNLARLTDTNQPAATTPKPVAQPKRSLLARIAALFGAGGHKSSAEKHLSKADRQALGLATPELMELLLTEKIEVTADEFRQLMTARARWVQDWFLEKGQVAADRLFLVAPKPVDAAYQGESRVNLSVN